MSLFGELNLKKEDRKEIIKFLNDPTLDHWNSICDIYLTRTTKLWRAVTNYNHEYIHQYTNYKWQTFPDSILLAKAIKMVAAEYAAERAFDSIWPRPAA